MTTRITIRDIPGHPRAQLIDKVGRFTISWAEFLQENNLPINADMFGVCNKAKKITVSAREKIGRMMQQFKRKATVTVVLVPLQHSGGRRRTSIGHLTVPNLVPLGRALPAPAQRPPVVVTNGTAAHRAGGGPAGTVVGGNRSPVGRPGGGSAAAASNHRRETSRSTAGQHRGRSPTAYRSSGANLAGSPGRGGGGGRSSGGLPPFSRHAQSEGPRYPGPPTDPNLLMPTLRPQNLSPHGEVLDIDDDALSQLSQDGDERSTEEGDLLKQQIMTALMNIPSIHLIAMREELRLLKEGPSQRDYKWTHYAPRTCGWVTSAFRP